MPYQHYSIEDFASDETFRRWVKNPRPEDVLFWEEWIAHHPYKKETIEEARRLVLLMDFESHSLPASEIAVLWQKMEKRTEKKEALWVKVKQPAREVSLSYRNWYKAAAVFAGFLLAASVYILFSDWYTTTKYTTHYGEIKTILLPDSSSVILNANSSLTFQAGWNKPSQIREVWLEGEAYFRVTHKVNNQKFVVHSPDVQVEVLGTTFNVNNRRNTTKVVLHSGKVKLDLPLSTSGNVSQKQESTIIMHPGEMVEFSKQNKKVSREKVNPELYTSWQNNKLVFNQASLLQIVQTLEDTYGLTVIVEDSALLNREFTATYPADDLDILYKALSRAFGIQITQEDNKVLFQRKP